MSCSAHDTLFDPRIPDQKSEATVAKFINIAPFPLCKLFPVTREDFCAA